MVQTFFRMGLAIALAAWLPGWQVWPAAGEESRYGENGGPNLSVPVNGSTSTSADPATGSIDRLLTRLVLDQIPHTYTDDRRWGQQAERWDGIRWERDGWQLRSKRRKREVNHGRWRKYSASLVDPQQHFAIELENLRQLADGRLAFTVVGNARLDIEARQANWVKGVRLYSISADAEAEVKLEVDCELSIDFDLSQGSPEIVLTPMVTGARLEVDEFELQRISKFDGELVELLSRASRSILEKKIEERQDRLVERLNRRLDENRERMRFSLSEVASWKWTARALPLLPDPMQQAFQRAPTVPADTRR